MPQLAALYKKTVLLQSIGKYIKQFLFLGINSKTIDLFIVPTSLSYTATLQSVKQAEIMMPHMRSTFMNFTQCSGES
jgi:hypothetical protein